jgi:hypothetical protein
MDGGGFVPEREGGWAWGLDSFSLIAEWKGGTAMRALLSLGQVPALAIGDDRHRDRRVAVPAIPVKVDASRLTT